ncbi:MAG: hypothetical protein RQ833_03425 [Sphingomonadaceae bacterium]|nr:hypothetical protein [Sphingomonadaceae bacterium]
MTVKHQAVRLSLQNRPSLLAASLFMRGTRPLHLNLERAAHVLTHAPATRDPFDRILEVHSPAALADLGL